MDPRIEEYIRANRRRYTREAITKQLEEAGHERAAIDATWAALEARDPDDVAGEGFWGRFLLILLGINLAVLALVGFGTGAFFSPERIVFIGVLAVALAFGALIAWGLVALTGPTKLGRTTATVIGVAIPLIFALLLGGACYAMVGSMSPPAHFGTMRVTIDGRDDLSGSFNATCFAGDPGAGFSVSGGRDRPPFQHISIDSYPGLGAPSGEITNLSMFVEPTSGTDQGQSFSNQGRSAQITSEVAEAGLTGSVEFVDLPSDVAPPGSDSPQQAPISGSITWTCE